MINNKYLNKSIKYNIILIFATKLLNSSMRREKKEMRFHFNFQTKYLVAGFCLFVLASQSFVWLAERTNTQETQSARNRKYTPTEKVIHHPSPRPSPSPYEFINKSHLLFGHMTNIVIRLRRRQRCIVGNVSVNKAALQVRNGESFKDSKV